MTAPDDDPNQVATSPLRWTELPTPNIAKRWEEFKPGTIDRMIKAVEEAERHDRRIEWAEFALRCVGTLSGLASVIILALVAKYFIDHGAPTQGAGVFGVGTASIIAAFITGRRGSK